MSLYKKSYPVLNLPVKFKVEGKVREKTFYIYCDTDLEVDNAVSAFTAIHCKEVIVYVLRESVQYMLVRE